MVSGDISLEFITDEDDPDLSENHYLRGQYETALNAERRLKAYYLQGGAAHGAAVALATIATLAGSVLGAWLQGRLTKKIRIKVGDIEAEANNRQEVEYLLLKALEI
jgi:hypothetical protein